jgi:hypothetical protein
MKSKMVSLKEEHKLQVVECKVLRNIFGPKKNEVCSSGHLHNSELLDWGRQGTYAEFWWGNLEKMATLKTKKETRW